MNLSTDQLPSTNNLLGMVLGGAEILVILIILAILAAIVITVVLVSLKASRSRDVPPPPDVQAATEARLLELDSLLAAGSITESEHAEQRKRILDSL